MSEQARKPPALDPKDRAILELAIRDDLGPGQILNHIRDLGLRETAYWLRLAQLLETEAALAAYPVDVNRLRSLTRFRRRWIAGPTTSTEDR